jgi:hypothetical protein
MQEWQYLDGPHTKETISYMVVEEGEHQLYDGTWIMAGSKPVRGGSVVRFSKKFAKAPIVFTQLTTQEKFRPYTTRVKSVTNRYFRVYVQAEEKQRVRETEEVSWVAWSLSKDKTTPW